MSRIVLVWCPSKFFHILLDMFIYALQHFGTNVFFRVSIGICRHLCKLLVDFSWNIQIKPLISPTRQIMAIGVKNYDWHELFPKGNCLYLFIFLSSWRVYICKSSEGIRFQFSQEQCWSNRCYMGSNHTCKLYYDFIVCFWSFIFSFRHLYLPRWILLFQVYFMDAQIWYSVYCSVFGGVYGILHHLGEVSCF